MFFSYFYPRSDLKLLLKHKTGGESRQRQGGKRTVSTVLTVSTVPVLKKFFMFFCY